MLTLTRRVGERILIGTEIEIEVIKLASGRVRLGIRAPASLPVLRGELVESIEAAITRARHEQGASKPATRTRDEVGAMGLHFPSGLFGMRDEHHFLIRELFEQPCAAAYAERLPMLRALVTPGDPWIRLLLADATDVHPDFPLERARELASFDEEVAVALVITVPANGAAVTANLVAPVVIGLESRQGVQVVLERDGLGLSHVIATPAAPGLAPEVS